MTCVWQNNYPSNQNKKTLSALLININKLALSIQHVTSLFLPLCFIPPPPPHPPGVSCDACLKGNFRGRRYKCLICYDYDLCASCYESGATTTRHTTEHPMQCILTRVDFGEWSWCSHQADRGTYAGRENMESVNFSQWAVCQSVLCAAVIHATGGCWWCTGNQARKYGCWPQPIHFVLHLSSSKIDAQTGHTVSMNRHWDDEPLWESECFWVGCYRQCAIKNKCHFTCIYKVWGGV